MNNMEKNALQYMWNNYEKPPRHYRQPHQRICTGVDHLPPTHLYIPADEVYIHKCLSCGQETAIMENTITMKNG